MAGAADIQFGQFGNKSENWNTTSTYSSMWLEGEDLDYSKLPQLPPEVLEAINQVLPSDDPLDQSDFDIVVHINTLFPTEQSLSQLNETIQSVEQDILHSDQEIRDFVRHQRGSQDEVTTTLTNAQTSIQALVTKVYELKNRAEQGEATVREMTREIRQLDTAKHNLIAAITTLNHLNMLLSGIDRLQSLVKTRQYWDVANLLQGVANVVEHFDNYQNNPQVSELVRKLKDIKTDLGDQISLEFRESFSSVFTESLHVKLLSEGCLVLDVLEPHVKHDLLQWIISTQLNEYGVLFDENEDPSWLDKVDKRFGWLKKHLIQFEERYGAIFPAHWDVSQRIAVQFCHQTRQDLSKLMGKRRHEIDVKLLLGAIQKTSSFENLLFLRFGGGEGEEADKNHPAGGDVAITNVDGLASSSPPHKNIFHRIIAQCFDPFLYIYVETQEKNLMEVVDKFVVDLKINGFPIPMPSSSDAIASPAIVLASCADLFVFYKKCLIQCTQLSCGEPLLNLETVFSRILAEYCNKILQANLPKVAPQTPHLTSVSSITKELMEMNATGLVRNFQSFLKEEEGVRLTNQELYRIACVLTTAEYCVETTQQLEEKLKEKLGSLLAPKLSLGNERAMFTDVIENSVCLLVQDLDAACEPFLAAITKTSWQAVDRVGDQSDFVSGIIKEWKSTVPTLRDYLATSRKHFVSFCQQFAKLFLEKYTSALHKCKGISKPGAQQLLLDTQSLKTVLLDLPSIGLSVKRKPPDKYSKLIVREMGRTGMVLKVIMTPVKQVALFVDQVIKMIPDCNDACEFSKILDMKGFKKTEQAPFIEAFKSKVSGMSLGINNNQFHDSREANVESSSVKKLEKLIKKRL